MSQILKRSPHYGQHVAHGAKSFFNFAGWEMPEVFSSLEEEAKACREAAILFDGHQMERNPYPRQGRPRGGAEGVRQRHQGGGRALLLFQPLQ